MQRVTVAFRVATRNKFRNGNIECSDLWDWLLGRSASRFTGRRWPKVAELTGNQLVKCLFLLLGSLGARAISFLQHLARAQLNRPVTGSVNQHAHRAPLVV